MADLIFVHSYLLLLWPLCGFVIIGLWPGHLSKNISAAIALAMSTLTLLTGLAIAMAYFQKVLADPVLFPDRTCIPLLYNWLNFAPQFTARLGIYLDPISVLMIVVITVVGLLVNIYSIGYMRNDRGFSRFFALLALFIFSMLGLVVAPNIMQMFVFWELVGISSYTLIGFWYEKPSAVAASKKAFIVTRFADAFFLLGIILVSYLGGSFDFTVLNGPDFAASIDRSIVWGGFTINLLTLSTLLIFAGGWGKSAMFPLHIWLPDAMEGPTPVSSIIHSATMVVAGVYLTARMFPLFAAADTTLAVIQFVGSFTAVFAALIAITQTDIKRILAFSTLSQLGYMMFSLGVAKSAHTLVINNLGYSAAMFHIFTHAFFKCMLFLGAGAIIHAVHSNDLAQMGGLRKLMPRTYWSMLAACLAIGGIFPLAGFWSKDAILLAALQSGHYLTFTVGLITSALTAFYMFRFFLLIFHGKARQEYGPVHEDPWMTWPIMFLVLPSVGAGWLANDFMAQYFIAPVNQPPLHLHHPAWLPYIAMLSGLIGIAAAIVLYGRGETVLAGRIREKIEPLYKVIYDKFYIDECYLFITHKIIFRLVAEPIKWFDRQVVDGAINMVGSLLSLGGRVVRTTQNGQLSFYLGIAASTLIMLFISSRLL